MGKILLLIMIILLELVFIVYLSIKLTSGNNRYTIIVDYLNKSQLVFYNKSQVEYKYFYEPTGHFRTYFSPLFKRNIISPINSDGFVERYNYSVNKEENTYRIISLGDSFTEGMWVNITDNYSEQLEDLLNNYSRNCTTYKKFEVINLGVAGYDIAYSYLRFKLKGAKYNPDLVIWILKEDDFSVPNEVWIEFISNVNIPSYEDTENHLKVRAMKVSEFRKLYNILKNHTLKEEYIVYPLKSFFELTRKSKTKVVIFTPHYEIGSGYDEVLEDVMKGYNHVTFLKLNIDPSFYAQNLMIYNNNSIVDVHPNEEGHRLIASKLFDYLIKNVLNRC